MGDLDGLRARVALVVRQIGLALVDLRGTLESRTDEPASHAAEDGTPPTRS